MAIVKPFKAIRPCRDKAAFVTSRPFGDYGSEELRLQLRDNPLSFLQIIIPGQEPAKGPGAGERYRGVRDRYLEFLDKNILQRDGEPGFYLYLIEKGDLRSLGFFCACSVEDYRKGVIKKHEGTLKGREDLFADYLYRVGFNAEPVLMTYCDNEGIDKIFLAKAKEVPECAFTASDGGIHKLWKITDQGDIARIEEGFAQVGSLYIADGHHRSASSNLLARRMELGNGSHCGQEPYNFFMAYLIPESQIKIDQYNRMIRDLNGLTTAEFLVALEKHFRLTPRDGTYSGPKEKHEFGMYLDGSYHSLYLRAEYGFANALEALDSQILYQTVLRPILGINDPGNRDRISYLHGRDNTSRMKELVDRGEYAVGFCLLPTTMEEIKAIADAGLVMPPKSTYIEPKPKSGLAIYEL